MKLFTLLLCVAFVTELTAVNGKNANHNEQHTKASVSSPPVKPTPAPMTASTVAPTKAPKVSATSTKATTVKAGSKSNNAAKKSTTKAAALISGEKKVETKPTEKTPMTASKDMEVKPIVTPVTVTTEKMHDSTKISHPTKAKEAKPLAVTGFITQNGSIYEIEDKDGFGKIEGRQNSERVKEHVCNYGSVVVYSDIPCDAVTNVKVSQMQDTPAVGQKPNGERTEEVQQADSNNLEINQNKDEQKEYEEEDVRPVRTRPNSKKPRRKNKKKLRKQQNNRRYSTRRVASRPNRQQSQNQRRSQQKKRRQQEKRLQENSRRQQVNHRRRVKTRPSYYDDYEDEEYAYSRGRDY